MGFLHNVEISWDALLNAFTNGPGDNIYFLDNLTGEIFFVSATLEDDNFWRHMETNRERFLEIPRFDLRGDKRIMSDFVDSIEDAELKRVLTPPLSPVRPFVNLDDILEFYPEEQARLSSLKDDFLSSRMKNWLEEHNLFTVEKVSPTTLHR